MPVCIPDEIDQCCPPAEHWQDLLDIGEELESEKKERNKNLSWEVSVKQELKVQNKQLTMPNSFRSCSEVCKVSESHHAGDFCGMIKVLTRQRLPLTIHFFVESSMAIIYKQSSKKGIYE
jgi:hypothetical protein